MPLTSGTPVLGRTVGASQAPGTHRRWQLDWIRCIVVLWLVPYHACRVYDTLETDYVKSSHPSVVADWPILLTGTWIMPLLFFVAGGAAFHSLQRRSAAQFAAERFTRLGVPLLAGTVLLCPILSYFGARDRGYDGGFLRYWPRGFWDLGDLTGYDGGFTVGHLWFLVFLLVMSYALLPLMCRWRGGHGLARLRGALCTPLGYAALVVPILALGAVPDLAGKNLLQDAGFFFLGFLLLRDGHLTDLAVRMRWPSTVVLILATAGWITARHAWGPVGGFTLHDILTAISMNAATLAAVLCALGFGRRLDHPSPLLAYLSHVAMPLYLLHLPVLVALAAFFVTTSLPTAAQLAFIVVGTYAVCLPAIALAGRWRPVRRALGMRPLVAA